MIYLDAKGEGRGKRVHLEELIGRRGWKQDPSTQATEPQQPEFLCPNNSLLPNLDPSCARSVIAPPGISTIQGPQTLLSLSDSDKKCTACRIGDSSHSKFYTVLSFCHFNITLPLIAASRHFTRYDSGCCILVILDGAIHLIHSTVGLSAKCCIYLSQRGQSQLNLPPVVSRRLSLNGVALQIDGAQVGHVCQLV